MILYVNGDSHAAAAEAVNPHAFAEDDSKYFYMGRAPHPDNIAVSWGKLLADKLKAAFHCGAESGSSNKRIIRTTKEWIDAHQSDLHRTLIVIGWSTWERDEWLIDGEYYQVNASGADSVPPEHEQRYKEFIMSLGRFKQGHRIQAAHEMIFEFHEYLRERDIKHIFFNGNNHFETITNHYDWHGSYINPYDSGNTYSAILEKNGFETVSPTSWHFGKTAHSFWSRFVLQYCIDNHFV